MTTALLLFSAGGRRLGVELELVTEIVDRGVVVALPRLPPEIAGVIPFRGVAVPLIDVGAWNRAGSPAAGLAPGRPRTIVVGTDGVRPVALLVDEVEGIVDAEECGDAERFDMRGWMENLS